PKRDLLEAFRNGASRSVLVGSHSFWEGIDVAGDDLQLVIIDKLPFPPPNDPLVQARCERVEEHGGNAFVDILIPEAAVTLKQGAGRLIRSETDRGMLVIGDSRLVKMGYGKRLMSALPAMQHLRSFDAAIEYIKNI
ncbi:MAG: ATP-dependent DNA helicase, partial [Saezia sp.]